MDAYRTTYSMVHSSCVACDITSCLAYDITSCAVYTFVEIGMFGVTYVCTVNNVGTE